MLSYFLHIMRQKSGGSSFVCVQLLQTLNILFENIRNETSLCKWSSAPYQALCLRFTDCFRLLLQITSSVTTWSTRLSSINLTFLTKM